MSTAWGMLLCVSCGPKRMVLNPFWAVKTSNGVSRPKRLKYLGRVYYIFFTQTVNIFCAPLPPPPPPLRPPPPPPPPPPPFLRPTTSDSDSDSALYNAIATHAKKTLCRGCEIQFDPLFTPCASVATPGISS